jgi:hypothetical protein
MAKAVRFFHKGTTMFNGSSIAAGYKLFQYQAGTTTKANTYTDSGKGTANSNPMTLNSDGRLDQDVYIDQSMKFVLAASSAGDPPSSSVWTIDNALSTEQLWTTVTKSADYTVTESDRDKVFLVDATSGPITITLLAAATAGNGFRIVVKKTDGSANAVTIDGNSSETIDGSLVSTIAVQYDSHDIISNGTSWNLIQSVNNPSTLTDANDNESIILTATASAVNEFTVVNAATGNAPQLKASGDDTNIDIKLAPKGTGNVDLATGGLELGGNEVLQEATSSQQGQIRLYEDTDNGSNYAGFGAAASIASSILWTLPSADGASGQYMQTNGSGTLSFTTPKVVQYILAASSSDDSTTSTSMQASSLSATITPTSASNRIVAIAFVPTYAARAASSPTDIFIDLRIRNTTNSTTVGQARAGGVLTSGSSALAPFYGGTLVMGYETAPSTSATTYQLQFASGTATNVTATIQGSTKGPAVMMLLELSV